MGKAKVVLDQATIDRVINHVRNTDISGSYAFEAKEPNDWNDDTSINWVMVMSITEYDIHQCTRYAKKYIEEYTQAEGLPTHIIRVVDRSAWDHSGKRDFKALTLVDGNQREYRRLMA